jgi:hypothetical protein
MAASSNFSSASGLPRKIDLAVSGERTWSMRSSYSPHTSSSVRADSGSGRMAVTAVRLSEPLEDDTVVVESFLGENDKN